MAKLAKRGKAREERGAIVPVRREWFPSFPLHLRERMEDLFGDLWTPWWPAMRWPEELARMPPVDVYEEGDEIVVKTELPGMKREEIEVQVVGDVVIISGKKEKEEKIERKDYARYERSAGTFSRSVQLPAEVQVEKMTAQLANGVLQIRAPKTEAAKSRSRKIEVS